MVRHCLILAIKKKIYILKTCLAVKNLKFLILTSKTCWTIVYIANLNYFLIRYQTMKYDAFFVEHPVYLCIYILLD